ncbi:MAG: M16 family metallopeptidase [Maricaulaceae bacterium]
MTRWIIRLAASVSTLSLTGLAAAQIPTPEVDIPYEEFTLNNGLRVIVHEDRKAPVVAVAVWYGVGSRDEPAGKTGFAHLFEHLMFNGSENYDGEWFEPLEQVGATGLNGTTSTDRTNYFQTVPTPALERILWMESDRMGHLLGAVTQEKLDEQRGVVQNEKRQGENQPYGRNLFTKIQEGLFPLGHPYHHSTIGSMEDLNNASLDDVKQWFKDYYGAGNAIVVLSGDINAEEARPLIDKYFGHIQSGPPVSRLEDAVPVRRYSQRDTYEEPKGPQARIYRLWATPGNEDQEVANLNLATQVLAGGRTSRLYKELVFDKQLATAVFPFNFEQELASIQGYVVQLSPGADLDEVNDVLDDVHAEFLENGPTKDELQGNQTSIAANTVRGLEQVGGFGGKSVTLASGALFQDDPGFWKTRLEWITQASPDDVLADAKEWLNEGYYQLDVVPFKETEASEDPVDRSTGIPEVTETPELEFPAIAEAELSNGMKVVLAERDTLPVVEMRAVFNAGYASDHASGAELGTANFAAAMLAEGTTKKNALELSAEAERLGLNWGSNAFLDDSAVNASALKTNLAESVEFFADVIRNPGFREEDIERYRARALAQIQQEKSQPQTIAFRILPPLMFGEDHAYGVPLTGSGTPESIQAITREDLVDFHQTWMRPDNMTLLVVGDTTLDEILPLLEDAFGDWKAPKTPLPKKNLATVDLPNENQVFLVDQPGSPQSVILAGHVGPTKSDYDEIAVNAANTALGGSFNSRINLNLREDKGWSYGSRSFLLDARGQQPWIVSAPVQTDKTIDSIKEIQAELAGYLGDDPFNEDELERIVNNNTRRLPGQYETARSVLFSLDSSLIYNRPWDYPTTLSERYNALTTDVVDEVAKAIIKPEAMTWVIIGDLATIEADVRALGLGPVSVMTADGEPVETDADDTDAAEDSAAG